MKAGDYAALIGNEVGRSGWFTIDQAMIDRFADLTHDRQFIHIDPVRAAATPFGTTVAHGFLTLSLLAAMARDALPRLDGAGFLLNYGFDRVRFISPVRAGERVRGRFALMAAQQRAPGEWTLTHRVAVEIEGRPRPAVVADWLTRRIETALAPGGEAG